MSTDPSRDDVPARRVDLSALRMDPEELDERRVGGRWGWTAVLAALAVGAVLAWLYLPLTLLLPRVSTALVEMHAPERVSAVLTATGYTYARDRAAVGAKIIGRVLELPVDEGDAVVAGQVLAVLDGADLRAAVAEMEATLAEHRAQLADAEREVERQRQLVAAGIAARATLDAERTRRDVAAARVESTDARLASARARLDDTVIRAPIDGVVIERSVEVGEMVAPGGFTSQQSTGAILRLADPASLEVEADINESYIARLRLGQPARIAVDAVPDHAYRGHLRQIVPTADRQRAVVEVKVALDDRDERLVPDMSCTVTFLETEEATAAEEEVAPPVLIVPAAAVIEDGREASVWVVVDGAVERRMVELGDARAGERVVLAGVAAGERVVLEPADLDDGQKVRVVPPGERP